MVIESAKARTVVSRAQRLKILTRCNITDLVSGLKVDRRELRCLVSAFGVVPAYGFARVLVSYDQLVARDGMVAGAAKLVHSYTRTLTVQHADRIPATGPLLIVANHPGLVDAMALVAALKERPDLRIIAMDRDLLRAIPHVGARLMYVSAERGGRTGLIRDVVAHLRGGGAVLTFPAGHIEPDPALDPEGAVTALAEWTDSAGLFLRRVPETVVLPIAVSGVISQRARRHPWSRRLEGKDRDSAAATLQVLWPPYRDTATVVRVGRPLDSTVTRTELHAAMATVISPA
ncbi:MAG TPA: 1-acyl-sn-glycerol-3-phosphate acyltransferase [Propionibacteriaceae bacterium]|nr:1-acyl-sn-glycerol-3-phosphate acyltransferase [Propionibacteriaceae bacterium]